MKIFFPVASALLMATTAASAANLVVDGGFEQPVVTTPNEFQSGFKSYNPGDSFGGPEDNTWTVVGSGNDVALTSNTEYTGSAANPTYYNAHSGGQWLDLSGSADNGARVGVSQTVATTAGMTYSLGFWVGSFVDALTTVELDVDGAFVGNFTSPTGGSSPGEGVNYVNFSVPVTATGISTTFAFFYAGGRSVAGLDDVSFSSTAAAVPEPASWALMITGFGVLGAAMRRAKPRFGVA